MCAVTVYAAQIRWLRSRVFPRLPLCHPKILFVVVASYNFHIPHVLVTFNCVRRGGWVADYLTRGGNLHISYI